MAQGQGYQERGVRFGPDYRLFGILTIPSLTDSTEPAVIFLNTGIEYRVGPHRLYVPVARELAAQGHVVLRYDVGGIGDSAPPPGAAENVAYPAHALDDAREAIAFIRKQAPGRRIVVAGLCSGGWHAFCAARDGLEVDAIVCINPPLYLGDGLPEAAPRPELGIGSYRRALRDAARWRKILRSRSAYACFARSVGAYVKWKISAIVRAARGGHLSDGLARELNAISARGITSLFVFSSGDGGLEYLHLHGRPALRRREVRKRIRHVVVNDAGHTFSPPWAQHALRRLLVDFVARDSAP